MALLETGVASDVLDLVSRMNTRLATEGWTINKFDTTDPDVYELFFSRLIDGDTRYFQVRGNKTSDFLYTVGATGFDTGQTFDNQPGKGTQAVTNSIAAPIKQYKFWGAASYFYVSLQKQTGIYGHAGVGVLEKCGTWVGGEFAFGTLLSVSRWDEPNYIGHAYPFDSISVATSSGSIRVDTGFGGSVWHPFSSDLPLKTIGQARTRCLMARLRERGGPNQFNGQTILLPAYCHVRKQVPEPAWLYAGYPPDLRFLNIGGLGSEDNIVLGADTWNTFPIAQKNGASQQPNSATYGIAYKEN